jgi:soluble lytic murein transglycosylase-like protein
MIALIITYYSLINGIDPSLAFRMAKVESGMNPNAMSRTNDGGLFQLNGRAFKFHNEKMRYHIVTNTSIAMNTLRNLKERCGNKFIVCYNIGVTGTKRLKNPLQQTYHRKMNLVWR